MDLNWKKGLFASTYQLFVGEQEAGYLKERTWSRKATGMLNDTKVVFQKKGIFSSKAEIKDPETEEVLGQIEMSTWRNKASITLGNRTLNWKFSNNWNTKWELLEDENPIIKYKSRTFSGKAESQVEDELMILTGLFIFNHFTQIMLTISSISAIIIVSGG